MSFAEIKELVHVPLEKNEGTDCPFWYIAVNGGGVLRRPVMVSHGIWFSREAAEEHLAAKAHRYPTTAFVYCDSAHMSATGLKKLFDIAREPDKAHRSLRNVRAMALSIQRNPQQFSPEEIAAHLLRFVEDAGLSPSPSILREGE